MLKAYYTLMSVLLCCACVLTVESTCNQVCDVNAECVLDDNTGSGDSVCRCKMGYYGDGQICTPIGTMLFFIKTVMGFLYGFLRTVYHQRRWV